MKLVLADRSCASVSFWFFIYRPQTRRVLRRNCAVAPKVLQDPIKRDARTRSPQVIVA